MKWEDLIELLRDIQFIAVVGTPRSGTRISTRILAEELGRGYIEEERWQDNSTDLWRKFLSFLEGRKPDSLFPDTGAVIHAPQLTPFIHRSDDFVEREDIGFVFVIRDPSEIQDSWRRLKREGTPMLLTKGPNDLCKLYDHPITTIGEDPGDAIKDVALVQLAFWREKQTPKVAHSYELEYESLSTHRLWIPKTKRVESQQKGGWSDRATG